MSHLPAHLTVYHDIPELDPEEFCAFNLRCVKRKHREAFRKLCHKRKIKMQDAVLDYIKKAIEEQATKPWETDDDRKNFTGDEIFFD